MHGVEGQGNDAAFLEYTLCSGAWVGAERAFEAMRDAGVNFTPVPSATCLPVTWNPNTGVPRYSGWFADPLPSGEFVFDEVHGVRRVTSVADPAYFYVNLAGAKLLGLALLANNTLVGGPAAGSPTGPSMGWEMFINDVDYDFTDDLASDLVFVPPPTKIRQAADVVSHELMHVMGAAHTTPSSGLRAVYPSATHTNSGALLYAHQGLEIDAEIYHAIGGPVAGEHLVTAADQAFLYEKYYAQSFDQGRVRMHAWETDAQDELAPVGWEHTSMSTRYIFPFAQSRYFIPYACMLYDQPLVTATLDAIEEALPRFTSVDGATLEVSYDAVFTGDPGAAVGVTIAGTTTITVPADGAYSAVPNVAGLVVIDAYNTRPGGYISYEPLLVTITVKDVSVSPPQTLFSSVPLNVEIAVANCGN